MHAIKLSLVIKIETNGKMVIMSKTLLNDKPKVFDTLSVRIMTLNIDRKVCFSVSSDWVFRKH